MSLVGVDPDWLVERVARRVVELLQEQQQPTGLVDAATLARLLGVSRSTIYDRASELGAVQVGDGARPRLRFDVETARNALVAHGAPAPTAAADASTPTVRRRSKRARSTSGVRLLPVKGREAR